MLFHKYTEKDRVKICRFYQSLCKYDFFLYGYLNVLWNCVQQYPSYPMFHYEESGIWEECNQVVAMAHLSGPGFGEVSIDIHPYYVELFEDMIDYAEQKFCGTNMKGIKYIRMVFAKTEQNIENILSQHNYQKCGKGIFFFRDIRIPMHREKIPDGFRISSLDKVYSFQKLSVFMWDFFGYGGEAPCFDDDIYPPVKQAWFQYQRELCTVILTEEDQYAAFCGVWYDQNTKAAYINPQITGKQYRNLNLGKMCIYETIKKCRNIGALTVYVMPNEKDYGFYNKMGFMPQLNQESWLKEWNG